MSLTATRWAWQQSIAAGPKYVLLALADYADNEGACFSLINLSQEPYKSGFRTLGFLLR